MQAKELPYLLKNKDKGMPVENGIYVNAISKLPSEALDKAKRLNEEKNSCNAALNVLYEDLALLLGKHEEFSSKAEEWAVSVNATTRAQKQEIEKLRVPVDYEYLSSPFRHGIEAFMIENSATLPELMSKISQTQRIIAEKELDRLRIDEKLFMDYRGIVLPEIKSRLKGGFLTWLFA